MEQAMKGARVKSPAHFGKADWKELLKRAKTEISKDNLGIVSAGVAFFIFLGIFPLLAAFISIYGYVASPEDVMALTEMAQGIVPSDIIEIFESQLRRLVVSQVAGWAALISLVVAIWSGSRAIKGLMVALNIAYGEKEDRKFLKKQAVALLMTFGGILTGVLCVFLLAGLPVLSRFLEFTGIASTLMEVLRWTLLAIIIITASSILYRWAPNRKKVKWRWITPGTTIAALVWLLASGLFSWYVSNFGNYNKTYGSLGAMAILLLWLSLSAFVFILGAELDSELERQAGINQKPDKKQKVK